MPMTVKRSTTQKVPAPCGNMVKPKNMGHHVKHCRHEKCQTQKAENLSNKQLQAQAAKAEETRQRAADAAFQAEQQERVVLRRRPSQFSTDWRSNW